MKIKNKYIRIGLKCLMWVCISMVGLLLLAILFVWIFSDKIEQRVVEEVNQNINTEIQVADINVSLFYDFPNVAVVFQDITMLDATPQKSGKLFIAKEAALEFNLLSIIAGNYSIRKLSLKNGNVNMKIYEDGKNNFTILKPSTDNTDNNDTEFDLQNIEIKNVDFSFSNKPDKQNYSVFIYNFKALGKLSEKQFDLRTKGSFRVDTLYTDDTYFIPGQKIKINGVLDFNTQTEIVSFNSAKIIISDIELNSFGKIEYADKTQSIDINIKSDNIKMEEIIGLLPEKMQTSFSDFKKEGDFSFNCKIAGNYDKNEISTNLKLSVNNGAINQKDKELNINKICFNADFSSSNISLPATYELKIDKLSALVNNKLVSGNFVMKNFKQPKTKINLKGELPLEIIQQFAKVEEIKQLNGIAKFNVSFDGLIKDINNINIQDFLQSKTSGTLSLENAEIKWSSAKYPLKQIYADAEFSNQDLTIKKLSTIYGKSDFNIEGSFSDFVSFIFEDNRKMHLTGKLGCKNLDILDIISENDNSENDSSNVKVTLPNNIIAKFDINVDKLSYGKFGASKVVSSLQMNNKKLSIENLSCKTLGGRIRASGIIDNSKNNNLHISCETDFTNLDIREALISFNEFGQTSITSENIRGCTNTNIQLSGDFSDNLEIDDKSINAIIEIEVANGELVGYAPLNGMKKILKNRDMENIKFEKLKNTISIKDKVISIPKMEIRSTAMNLKLSGMHSFDNEIEYHVEVKFSDLKGKNKNNGPENEYGYVVDTELGRTAFLLITGTVDNPNFKQLDKDAMKEKIKDDISTEKKNMKKILHDEFGLFKKDTTLKKIETPKKQDTKFVIDWDEE